ncbi:uncharacterized protein LOC109712835 isoform X1 [Ananas comosus]|uniref:Uncharacterized protein LOC109712835 isoform X1 n=1 Tax=Ananas comosus TaxID=4615 RepID=A0A6P5F8A7_ANACO|nr:uncharacterized protein LOC109712835 isoform X1 [Ananas comosus]
MTQSWEDNAKSFAASGLPSSSHPVCPQSSQCANLRCSGDRNVVRLLALREISPRAKRYSKRRWGKTSDGGVDSTRLKFGVIDAKHALYSWVESESLRHLTAKYCPLLPPPRSTIAAAFSSDGRTLASTHGDHTVKIIDCQTGNCLKVLSGHRRTPWVVRFHPLCSEILASGSLDHEVRLWDARTADCIGSRNFYRPIASIAFHAKGEILAVASGHKLFIWNYNKRGEASSPTIVLKTRRSLRAVHFHPCAAPFLLTAEVNSIDSSDPPLTLATSSGYLHYPPPTYYFANTNPSLLSCTESNEPRTPSPMDISTETTEGQSMSQQTTSTVNFHYNGVSFMIPFTQSRPGVAGASMSFPTTNGSNDLQMLLRDAEAPHLHQFISFNDPSCWDHPFLQGWLMGQNHAHHATELESLRPESLYRRNAEAQGAPPLVATAVGNSITSGQPESDHLRSISIESGLPTSLASAGVTEIPCTVKLRIWPHNIQDPCAPLDPDTCRLTISHAVLCSEMGAHFSPCGRYLVACVACLLPHTESDPGTRSSMQLDAAWAATSPTRHPFSTHQVIYELRIYSLEEETFGNVLASRAIRAAHCLTSIQFSSTSEHILLAYGRRHESLLRSIVIDREMTIPIYTILEVYRVSDMELVGVLPSAEDEVNVACFHPLPGGGLVYGTKEGKLRILQYDGPQDGSPTTANSSVEENMLVV